MVLHEQTEGQISFITQDGKIDVSFCVKVKKTKSRLSWDDYGISKERYHELKSICQSGEYKELIRECAEKANPYITDQIYLSVTEGKSYEGVEYTDFGRIPCGRTDFYGYRRLFYHFLDLEMGK